MMQAPPQPALEIDPLDAHLADLEEEPGAMFLQDFLARPVDTSALTATPLSNATDTPNGYTSEETDYSGATPPPPAYPSQHLQQQQQYKTFAGPGSPSDEQMYQDMSFLQSADTSELVEVVADYCSTEDLTTLSPQTQRKFAGKVIKGKTSKYRGVTQTSKTSWGAKYSAKRITNTCKTPDEAAHAYDMYLKQHYPQKYSKFANFCEKCGRFVNPLGLPEYRNECDCTDRAQFASPSPGDVTSPESSAAGSPVSAASDGGSGGEAFRASSLSVGSMKFSFSDDADKFFDESLSMVASFETAQQAQNQTQNQTQPAYPGVEPASPTLQKRDSLPLAVISSAVESFTQDDNLDQIIEDINRPSSSAPFAKPAAAIKQPEPTSSSSTAYVDFSMDELQDLSEYFLSDQSTPPAHAAPVQTASASVSPAAGLAGKHAALKKIHSLDFDAGEYPMDVDADAGGVKAEPPARVLLQTSSMQDIDAIATSFMRPHVVAPSLLANAFPAVIDIQTPFLEKYWRNDRKNIQCFPYCPEHGDYYRVRIEDLQHRCKGVCRAAVKAHIRVPGGAALAPPALLVLARCNSTFSRAETLGAQAQLSAGEMKALQAVSAVGAVEGWRAGTDGAADFDVTFYPDVWKFEFDLPKKRRNVSASSPAEAADAEHLASEFLYFFEIDVFAAAPEAGGAFRRLGHSESINFQIGNTRTLLRQRNKMTEDAVANDAGADDRVLDLDALPEKKKIKVRRGQHALPSLSTGGDDADAALLAHAAKSADADKRAASDAGGYHMDVATPHEQPAASYNPYLSPKPKEGGAQVAAAAAAASSAVATARKAPASATQPPTAADNSNEAYSIGKLLPYTLVCVPLGALYVPLAALLLAAFVVLPPLAPAVVRALDTLADAELRRANSSCVARDPRRVLARLADDPAQAAAGGSRSALRYHARGAVWARFAYFAGVKLLVSAVALVPTLLLALLALITFPVRPASAALAAAACSCALWTREYTRASVGKPFVASREAPGDIV